MEIGEHDSQLYSKSNLHTCSNCHRHFPKDKIQLHQAYCSRNFRKCILCGVMIDKSHMADHEREVHSTRSCEYCSQIFVGRQLQQHLQQCMARPVPCPYCNHSCPFGQLEHHKITCGMRRRECIICRKLIPVPEYEGHLGRCEIRQRQRRESSGDANRQVPSTLHRQSSEKRMDRQRHQEGTMMEPKVKSRNVIGRQTIKTSVDIIPISIRLGLKKPEASISPVQYS